MHGANHADAKQWWSCGFTVARSDFRVSGGSVVLAVCPGVVGTQLTITLPVPHTGDPVLTSGRVKGGDAIT